jgi:hypothetical protein
VDLIEGLAKQHPVNIRITKKRQSKLGDFRPLPESHFHAISINHDLNKYAFLLTLIHEFAHLVTWKIYKSKVSPHGAEWKYHFQQLMIPFMQRNIFPDDIQSALMKYMRDPAASSCSSPELMKTLGKYDEEPSIYLDDLPNNSLFKIKNQTTFLFKKGMKARKRYKCLEMRTKREYWVSGHAEVEEVRDDNNPLNLL